MKWNVEHYARNARFVAEYGEDVVELLAPTAKERILDVGCGDGALTAIIVACGADVVGIDASPEFVEVARRRGIDARLGDAQALTFNAEFDAVFSNAALHWMPRTADVLAGIRRALRPGGRFVGELGGHGNVAAIRTAIAATRRAHGIADVATPWLFPTRERFTTALQLHGFRVEKMALFGRPTPLASGLRAWLETFGAPFVTGLAAQERVTMFDETVALLEPVLCDTDGRWYADYVRLRFAAVAL